EHSLLRQLFGTDADIQTILSARSGERLCRVNARPTRIWFWLRVAAESFVPDRCGSKVTNPVGEKRNRPVSFPRGISSWVVPDPVSAWRLLPRFQLRR